MCGLALMLMSCAYFRSDFEPRGPLLLHARPVFDMSRSFPFDPRFFPRSKLSIIDRPTGVGSDSWRNGGVNDTQSLSLMLSKPFSDNASCADLKMAVLHAPVFLL